MNAASQVPSGVLTLTSVSTTGRAAPNAGPAAATIPAATDPVTKRRREISVTASISSAAFFSSADMSSAPCKGFMQMHSAIFQESVVLGGGDNKAQAGCLR